MTTSDWAKEIQKVFDLNHIYAKHVFSMADKSDPLKDAPRVIDEKPKPFVKWVGGKRQLLKQFKLMNLYPHYYLINKTAVLNWYTFA